MSPTMAHDERIQVQTSQASMATLKRSIDMDDYNNWEMARDYFHKYSRQYGPFDLDAASDNDGKNSHVAYQYCCPAHPFQERDLRDVQRLWLHAPYDQIEDYLAHYLRQKLKYPKLRAVVVVPRWTRKPWYRLVNHNFRLIDEIPATTDYVFSRYSSNGTEQENCGERNWITQVFIDKSDEIQFLPQYLRSPPKEYWTHAKALVTDGKRVLLTKEDNGTVWFPGGKRDAEDETPEQTVVREILEETGYTVKSTVLQRLGTQTTGEKKCPVYVHRVRPGSIPKDPPSDRAVWATWEELLRARTTGTLVLGDLQYPLRFDEFGPQIDSWINENVKYPSTSNTLAVSTSTAGTKLLTLTGTVRGRSCRVLIDSGASDVFVRRAWVTQNRIPMVTGDPFRIMMANGATNKTTQRLRGEALTLGSMEVTLDGIVTDLDEKFDIILGQPWLTRENPDIDWAARVVKDRTSGRLLAACEEYTVPVSVRLLDATTMAKSLRKEPLEVFVVGIRKVLDDIHDLKSDQNEQWTNQLREHLEDFADIIAEPQGLPPEREWDVSINLESDIPPKERTYRMSPAELREVKSQIEELLSKGWIQPSKSPYGAPILFVRKKDGSLRMCVDYRKLNDITKKDRTPLPRIDELLDSLYGANVFSTLDLYKGYHQVRVRERDIQKTAFRTAYGLYEYNVLPFGLCNAPASFQTMMTNVLRPYLGKFCVVYLDDVLIYSKTPEDHLRHIRLVLQELQRHKLHIKLSKCSFGMKSVEFLGHIVESGQIRMDPKKIEAVQNWPIPKNVTEVRGFLGLAGYYRKFIHKFAQMATPLTGLTQKDLKFQWTPQAHSAFEMIKEAMIKAPVLVIPNTGPDARYTLYTDASGFAVGAVLLQDQGHGLQPVAYHARKMNKHEVHYPVHEQELLAVRDALLKFRCYLDGAAGFTLITDHDTLRHFFRQRDLSTRQVRWLQVLSPYQRLMDIVYKKGAVNHADALSRRPDLKDALDKLRLLDDWTNDEEACELNAMVFNLQSQLEPDSAFYEQLKTAYDADPFLSNRNKGLPSWLMKSSKGLYYAYGTRLYVPDVDDLRSRVLKELHDTPTAGHLGITRLLHKATRMFWWPRLKKTIEQYVKRCPTCQKNKAARHKPYGLLQPHTVPTRPFEHVSLDLITDLPECDGYDSVVVFVCMLSKRVVIEPCTKSITAEGLSKIMHRSVFRYYGLPKKIISDRDPRFMSDFWQSLFQALGTKLNISSAHHPQTDGQTERMNQTLEQILRCYVHPLHDDWVQHLTNVEFAMNAAKSMSTTLTPFETTLGYEPLTPLTIQFDDSHPQRTLPDHVEYLRELHRFAHDCVRAAQETQAKYANKYRIPSPFRVGQKAKLKASHLKFLQQPCAKLRDRYIGPFEIIEQISPVAFRIKLPPGVRIHDAVHASQLELWHDDPSNPIDPALNPVPVVHDVNKFYVDHIMDVAYNSNGTGLLFKVRWSYPYNTPSDDTWEPTRNVKDCEALDTFMKTAKYKQFTSMADFQKFSSRWPARVPTHA